MQSPAGHARSPSPFANRRVFLVASPVWPSPSNASTGIPFCRVHKTGSSSSIPNSCPAGSSIVGLRGSLAPGGDDSIMPSKADEIRAYALERYVRPWRGSDEKRLAIRAGDVVREMGLHNATPNVCSSLASQRFQRDAGIVCGAMVRIRARPQRFTMSPTRRSPILQRARGRVPPPRPAVDNRAAAVRPPSPTTGGEAPICVWFPVSA